MFPQRRAIRLLAFISLTAFAALAGTYQTATFTGNLSPGNANVRAPFNSVITQGGAVTGSFVFDAPLVPTGVPSFVNVFFADFPDIVNIPNATAFSLDLGGGIAFDLGSAVLPQFGKQEAAIQYKDGIFNGFFFVSDFTFNNSSYELNMQGRTFGIRLFSNGFATGPTLVNGTVSSTLTHVQSFTPTNPSDGTVPEPGSYVLLGTGLVGLAMVARIHSKRVQHCKRVQQ